MRQEEGQMHQLVSAQADIWSETRLSKPVLLLINDPE